MSDQKIYALMAKTPKIRAVQIADALGKDLKVVSDTLRDLVEIGDVVQSKGFSPDGRPAQVYDLSESFKCSRAGSELLGHILTQVPPLTPVASTAAPIDAPTVAPSAGPADAPVPATEPANDEPGRAARALAFIAENGSATDAQLRTLMGLRDDVYPSSYLTKDAQAGTVVKVGREWKLGDSVPLRPLTRQPAFGAPLGLLGATPFAALAAPPLAPPSTPSTPPSKVKRQLAPTPTPTPTLAPAPTAPIDSAPVPVVTVPVFRCGLWSDGTLEMQRNGVTVAVVHEDEAETVLNFMDRLRPTREVA